MDEGFRNNFCAEFTTKNIGEELNGLLRRYEYRGHNIRVIQIIPLGFFKRKTLVIFKWVGDEE